MTDSITISYERDGKTMISIAIHCIGDENDSPQRLLYQAYWDTKTELTRLLLREQIEKERGDD